MTTHSPNLAASVPVGRLTLVCGGRTFPLASGSTKLAAGDYAFLERFLDVTKANLFFAKAVLIVEGDGEDLLMPAIAQSLGHSLSKLGVSIVKVGHTGLFRYSNIFQRQDGSVLPIRVACLRDRDIAPDDLSDELRGKLKRESDLTQDDKTRAVASKTKRDGGSVQTFVSDSWTFEYDLARASWTMAKVMHKAISCAQSSADDPLDDESFMRICAGAEEAINAREAQGQSLSEVALFVFLPLKQDGVSKAIAAQYAARILSGVTLAREELPGYINLALDHLAGEKDALECG